MKIRNELLIFILIVLIIPLLLISIQSTKSLEDSAEREMRVKANSLTKECDAVFNAIEKQCSILGKEAEDIENNPSNYGMLYEPNEYFPESGGAYIATEPKNILDKSAIWVPNTVPITTEIKKYIGLSKNLEPLYKEVKAQEPNLKWVYTVYKNGLMRCYPFIYISSSEWDARNRDYYIDARDKKELIWSEPFFDIGGGGWVITCSMPLYDKNGDFFGVQCIDITLDTIVKNIIGVELYDTGYAFLINEKGNIIALPDRAEKDLFITYEGKVPTQEEIEKAKTTLTFSLLEHPNEEFVGLIKKAIEGETIMEKIKFDKEKYLTFVPIESTGWAVGIVAPVGEVLAPVRNAIIIALIVAIVGALGASLFAGKRFAQPLVKLSETSEKIARGDLLARVSIKSSIKEFSEVSNDINRMVDGLQSNIEELKQALDSYSKVLNEVALGNLSARVNTTQLKGAYSLLGETLNSIVSILEYDTEELKKKDTELSQTVSLCSGVLDKVTQQGDLSTRVNVSKLKGKYKQLGSDINLMADSLQNKINELKQTKGEIEESRVFLQQIMTNIPDILVVTDNEGHWLQVSPSFEELTGFKIKEVLGKKTTEQPVYKDLPEGIELNKQMWERVYKGEVVKGIEIPWRTKRGKKIILSASERTLKDSKGKDMGRVFVARDITRSRKHE